MASIRSLIVLILGIYICCQLVQSQPGGDSENDGGEWQTVPQRKYAQRKQQEGGAQKPEDQAQEGAHGIGARRRTGHQGAGPKREDAKDRGHRVIKQKHPERPQKRGDSYTFESEVKISGEVKTSGEPKCAEPSKDGRPTKSEYPTWGGAQWGGARPKDRYQGNPRQLQRMQLEDQHGEHREVQRRDPHRFSASFEWTSSLSIEMTQRGLGRLFAFDLIWSRTLCRLRKRHVIKGNCNNDMLFVIHNFLMVGELSRKYEAKSKYKNAIQLQNDLENADLAEDLNKFWPRLIYSSNIVDGKRKIDYTNSGLWLNELWKHGPDVMESLGIDDMKYFEVTLTLYKRFNPKNCLEQHNIFPSDEQKHSTKDVYDALARCFLPGACQLHCVLSDKSLFLYEIRITLDAHLQPTASSRMKEAQSKDPRIVPCKGHMYIPITWRKRMPKKQV